MRTLTRTREHIPVLIHSGKLIFIDLRERERERERNIWYLLYFKMKRFASSGEVINTGKS